MAEKETAVNAPVLFFAILTHKTLPESTDLRSPAKPCLPRHSLPKGELAR